MRDEVTSATTRESRILLRAMDALSGIPDLLTIDFFEELLKIQPHYRGRGTRALGAVLVLFTLLVVCYPAFLTIADINGSPSATAEQLLDVLAQVILIVISGQPAQLPLFIGANLNRFVVGAGHRHSPAPGSSTATKKKRQYKSRVRDSKD